MKTHISRLLFLSVILGGAYALNRSGFLQKTLDWVAGYGAWAPAVFVLVYVLSCIFFVPSFIFTFSSGILFGFWKGAGLSLMGNGLGSLSAFLIGRYLAREWVEARFSKNPEFQRLSRAVGKKGWKVVLLARLSPVFPFLVGNYAFGATRIRAWHYALASTLGSIPSALLYSYLGFLTGDLAGFRSLGRARTPQEWLLLGLGLAATFLLAWYLRKLAERDAE